MTTVQYLFVVNDIEVNFDKLSLDEPVNGFDSIEAFRAEYQGASEKKIKIAYFFEGAQISYQSYQKRKDVQALVTGTMSIWIGLITLIFIIFASLCVYDKSARVTKSIIQLLEKLEEMQFQAQGSQRKPELSYRAATKELNEL